jgi:potassium efflux system protein
MTITHALVRRLALWVLAAALLAAGALPGGLARAEQAEATSLDSIKTTLDEIEEAVGREDVSQEALVELRQKLNATADDLRGKVDELEPRVGEAEERLKQLGPAPAKDAPPEAKEIADQREELTASFNELDGALKQARVLTVRIDQLSERVSQRRHALYASELFARTSSIFDPFFWADTFRALPIELRSAQALMESWWYDRGNSARAAGAAVI